MNKCFLIAIVFMFAFGCKHRPTKITNPTPGGIIVVDEEGNESEFPPPLTEAEFKQFQDDMRKQNQK